MNLIMYTIYLFLGLFESCLLLYVGARITGHTLELTKLLVAAALHIAAVIGFRQLYSIWPLPLGTHTVLSLVLLILLLHGVTGASWLFSTIGSLFSLLFVLVGGILISLITTVLPLSVSSTASGIALVVIEKMPLLLIALLTTRGLTLLRLH